MAKFCDACGCILQTSRLQFIDSNSTEKMKKSVEKYAAQAISSDFWLMAWAKAILPLHGVLGLIFAIVLFNGTNFENASDVVVAWKWFSVFIGAVSALTFFVAYGLKKCELWAWNVNWAALILIGIEIAVLAGAGFLFGILIFIIWIFANRAYWVSRKSSFK